MRIAPQNLASPHIDFTKGDTVQAYALGTKIIGTPLDPSAVANSPNGAGTFIYAKALGAVVIGAPVQLDKDYNIVAVPVTGNTGAPVFFAASLFSVLEAFGWVAESGNSLPVKVSVATAAAAPLFITAAGTVGGTVAAGKQVLGALVQVGSTGSFIKTGTKTINGSSSITVPDVNGLYSGLTLSGTGIVGGQTITEIDAGSRRVKMSAAATASGNISMTCTHTGYVIASVSCAHVQSQIT